MNVEKNLITLLIDYIEDEYCCNDCFLMKVRELLNADISCDEELKRRLQLTVNDKLVSDDDKVATIVCFINEFYQEDN